LQWKTIWSSFSQSSVKTSSNEEQNWFSLSQIFLTSVLCEAFAREEQKLVFFCFAFSLKRFAVKNNLVFFFSIFCLQNIF
jgi:hypothetical protein